MKGYERLLSLSKDTENPRLKPLHLAANWNSRNRTTAKMLSKTNWFKGKSVLEPQEVPSNQQGGVQSESNYDAPSNSQGTSSLQGGDKKVRHNKKRGADRGNITLGGLKKVEVANKRRAMQKLNKKLGKLDLPSSMKSNTK